MVENHTPVMLEKTTFCKIAELLPDAVVMTDKKGQIVWTNQAFHDLCGYTRSAVKTRKPGSFLQGPDTDPETVKRISQAIKVRDPVEAEILNYHFDGHPYWVSLRIIPIWTRSGELEGFLAVEREITTARFREHSLEKEVVQLYSTLIRLVEEES